MENFLLGNFCAPTLRFFKTQGIHTKPNKTFGSKYAPTWNIHLGFYPSLQSLVWTSIPKTFPAFLCQDNEWQCSEVYPAHSQPRPIKLSFNLTKPPVRLLRTWAPPGGQSWASLPCGWFWPGSPSAVSVCLSILSHLAGTAQKGEPAARPSTSFRARNLSFFTRDEAFYETKWVSFKWSATKAPWLICLLGYCSCHLWKTSGQQID